MIQAETQIVGIAGAGPMIINDWAISVEEIEGGHRLIARRGSEEKQIDIMDAKAPQAWVEDSAENVVLTISGAGGDQSVVIPKIAGDTAVKSGAVVSMDAWEGDAIGIGCEGVQSAVLVQQGRNWLPTIAEETAANGVTWTPLEDGRIRAVGTAEGESMVYLMHTVTGNARVFPAGRYVVSSEMPPVAVGGLSVNCVTSAGATKYLVSGVSSAAAKTFELTEPCTVRATIALGDGVSIDAAFGVQIERAEEAGPYEKHWRAEHQIEAFPATIEAAEGENILYTGNGDVLTASVSRSAARIIERAVADRMEDDFEKYGVKVLWLEGDVSAMSKENAVTLGYAFGELSGTLECKWQGASSLSFPKKNYTLKFDQAFEAADGWGVQKKYCCKANWNDFSHVRNVVSAKLWGEVLRSRASVQEDLAELPNGGAIDGFPVIIMLNGGYHGLYSFNIPKDGWMFGMGDGDREAILCGDYHVAATQFREEAMLDGTDFELEYASDEDNAEWVKSSINALIRACIASDGSDLDTTVAEMLDWDSAIDLYVFGTLIGAADMLDKNHLLVTRDGVKWWFTPYDMDNVFGNFWDGSSFYGAEEQFTLSAWASRHRVMELIRTHKLEALRARFEELVAGPLSEDNVAKVLTNYAAGIPSPVLDAEARAWPSTHSTGVQNIWQIMNWYRLRLAYIRAELERMQ